MPERMTERQNPQLINVVENIARSIFAGMEYKELPNREGSGLPGGESEDLVVGLRRHGGLDPGGARIEVSDVLAAELRGGELVSSRFMFVAWEDAWSVSLDMDSGELRASFSGVSQAVLELQFRRGLKEVAAG